LRIHAPRPMSWTGFYRADRAEGRSMSDDSRKLLEQQEAIRRAVEGTRSQIDTLSLAGIRNQIDTLTGARSQIDVLAGARNQLDAHCIGCCGRADCPAESNQNRSVACRFL